MNNLTLTLLILIIFILTAGCGSNMDDKVVEYSRIIEKIDLFLLTNKRTPNEHEFYELIKKLGYQPSETCPCYTRISYSEYELYFGLDLGTSMVYNSKTKKWSKEG